MLGATWSVWRHRFRRCARRRWRFAMRRCLPRLVPSARARHSHPDAAALAGARSTSRPRRGGAFRAPERGAATQARRMDLKRSRSAAGAMLAPAGCARRVICGVAPTAPQTRPPSFRTRARRRAPHQHIVGRPHVSSVSAARPCLSWQIVDAPSCVPALPGSVVPRKLAVVPIRTCETGRSKSGVDLNALRTHRHRSLSRRSSPSSTWSPGRRKRRFLPRSRCRTATPPSSSAWPSPQTTSTC